MQVPITLRPSNLLAWEVFTGPARDQWTESGRYDYGLAIKLLEAFGCDPPELIESVDRLALIIREVKRWSDMKHERDEEAEEFKRNADKALSQL